MDDDSQRDVTPRSRVQLAIDIAIYGVTHDWDDDTGTVPGEFFDSEEEIELAKSLTREEVLTAGACVMEALAEQETTSPRVREAAWTIADTLRMRVLARCARRPVRRYVRQAPRTRPRSRARRARAPARPDSEPDPELSGLAVASRRMFLHERQRQAARRAAA